MYPFTYILLKNSFHLFLPHPKERLKSNSPEKFVKASAVLVFYDLNDDYVYHEKTPVTQSSS